MRLLAINVVDEHRNSTLRVLVVLILAAAIIGSALHLHTAGRHGSGKYCLICHCVSLWMTAAAVFTIFVSYRRLSIATIVPHVLKWRPIHFAHPCLRAPPLPSA